MKELTKLITIFIMIQILSGCIIGGKMIYLTDVDIIENPYIRFSPPEKNWYLYRDREWTFQYGGTKSEDRTVQWISLSSVDPSIVELDVSTDDYFYSNNKYYFSSDFSEDYGREFTQEEKIKRNKMQGIKREELWTTYINGIHCKAVSKSNNFGGSYAPTGHKSTYIRCGYYDKTVSKNDGMRMISIRYSINFYASNTDKQNLEKELYLKNTVWQVVKSIKIKNLDVERMEAEGLMFYDKSFELTPKKSFVWKAK